MKNVSIDIGQLADQQGWSGDSLGDLAWAFIANYNLMEQFAEYLVGVAETENEATCENCGRPCEYHTEVCLCPKCEAELEEE